MSLKKCQKSFIFIAIFNFCFFCFFPNLICSESDDIDITGEEVVPERSKYLPLYIPYYGTRLVGTSVKTVLKIPIKVAKLASESLKDSSKIDAPENSGDQAMDSLENSESSKDSSASDETSKPIDIPELDNFGIYEKDIPSNFFYKSKEDIGQIHPKSFQEAVGAIEGGIFYDSVGNGLETTFSLRGFQEGSAVTFLVDGVKVNELDGDAIVYPLLDMNDVESISVEKGSASPIYGSGAFAGVVNIKTGQPSERIVSLFGGFDISSHKGKNFYQGISGTIPDKITPLKGKFKYYFKGGRNVGDGFRQNSNFRITSFDIKVAYELSDNLGGVHIGLKHVDDLISNPGELTFDQYQQDPSRCNKPLDRRDYQMTIFQIGMDKKFLDNHFAASTLLSWRINKNHFYTTSGTFSDWVSGSNPDTDLITSKTRATDWVWQLMYEDDFKEINHQSIIGMELRGASEYSLEQDAFGGQVNESVPRETNRSSEPSNVSLFGKENVKLFKKVSLNFGMRHDFFKLRTRDALAPTNNISRRWRKSSFSTGITVNPTKFFDIFANYFQGFRVPTISELAGFGTINPDLLPEKSDSYEIGVRARWNNLVELKTSYFLIDMKDEIVFDSSSITALNPWGQNINIGKSRRYGIETGLEVNPLSEINFYGTYTWTKAYIRETDGGGSLIDGRDLGQIPAHKMTWGALITPLKRLGTPYDGFTINIIGSYTGKQHPTSFESASQAMLDATDGAGHIIKGYTLWDMIVSLSYKRYELFFKVNNVFNKKYYSRAVSSTSWGTAIYPAGTYTFVNPGAPREYTLGLRWEF